MTLATEGNGPRVRPGGRRKDSERASLRSMKATSMVRGPALTDGPKLLFRSGGRVFIVTPAAGEAHQALPLAIDAEFEFVRITLQPCERNLKLVFAIEREITVDRQTAPCAERQFFLAALLRLADGCLVYVHKHAHFAIAHRKPADLSRGIQIALHGYGRNEQTCRPGCRNRSRHCRRGGALCSPSPSADR